MGLIDPQVALTLLRMCGGFCRLVHLARTTPPSLSRAALQLYDQDVRRCFSSCTAVDTSDVAWKQSMLGLSKGGLGLRSLHHHAPAAYIASVALLGLDPRPTIISVLQLHIFIQMFHQIWHCRSTLFSQLLQYSNISFPACWTPICSI